MTIRYLPSIVCLLSLSGCAEEAKHVLTWQFMDDPLDPVVLFDGQEIGRGKKAFVKLKNFPVERNSSIRVIIPENTDLQNGKHLYAFDSSGLINHWYKKQINVVYIFGGRALEVHTISWPPGDGEVEMLFFDGKALCPPEELMSKIKDTQMSKGAFLFVIIPAALGASLPVGNTIPPFDSAVLHNYLTKQGIHDHFIMEIIEAPGRD